MNTLNLAASHDLALPNAQRAGVIVARLFLAAIFLLSGAAKVADPQGTIGYIQSVGLPFANVGYAAAVAIELIGGLALVFGFGTRIAAYVLAAFTLAAGAIFHNQLGDQIQFIMFFKNVAIAGGLLQVALTTRK